ncbi:MAG: hypothetical protein AAFZ15_19795 [Bacteroidota bacterium]
MPTQIGQHQSEMITAIAETGEDVPGYVKDKFKNFSPHFLPGYFKM